MVKKPNIDENAPWKQRFRIPRTAGLMIAEHDQDRGLAISNRSDIFQLYAWDVPTGELRQLTHRSHGVFHGLLSPDGKHVYYHHDEQGNEEGHIRRIPFEGGDAVDITPDFPPYSMAGLSISKNGKVMGLTRAGRDGFSFHLAELSDTGEPGEFKLVRHETDMFFGPSLSADGSLALMVASERPRNLKYHLLVFDTASLELVGMLSDEPDGALERGFFSPIQGDNRVLAVTNKSGYPRPFIWNPLTGERRELNLQQLAGDLVAFAWSKDGRYLLMRHVAKAVQHLYLYDLEDDRLIALNHPAGTFAGTYFGPGEEIFTHWMDSTHPMQLVAMDRTGAVKRTVIGAKEIPPCRPWKSITFTSSDSQEIQGWLAVPEGPGPYPVIFDTHGGPECAQLECFDSESQAWLDHGYAFITINYRGSTTFGREFKEKIWQDLGHWEVEDMEAAYRWLVENNIARPDQVLLTGWSYGGYLTLQGLGVKPDLWAGGMAGIAISDWRINHEESNEALRRFDEGLFGGTPDEVPERFAKSSPVTYVDRVKAPVLVIQGKNDTRCPPRQIEEYQEKLQALGKHIEVIWFDTGHAGSGVDLNLKIKHQEQMLTFAHTVLGQTSEEGNASQ